MAWQRMVQIYGPLVYNWARRLGANPQDAADVTQETFAVIATRLSGFDANRKGATFCGWLWTITRNKVADLVRRISHQPNARGGSDNVAKLQQLVDSPSASLNESTDASSVFRETADQQEVLHRAIAMLRASFEPTTWQAFWRTVVEEGSPEDVALELGLTRWAVYKARSRVLQRLRRELDGLEELQ